MILRGKMFPDDPLLELLALCAIAFLAATVPCTVLKFRRGYLAQRDFSVVQPSLPFLVLWLSLPSMFLTKLIDKYLTSSPSANIWLILISATVPAIVFGMVWTSREIIWNSDFIKIRQALRKTKVIPRNEITSVTPQGGFFMISAISEKILCDNAYSGSREFHDAVAKSIPHSAGMPDPA